MFKPSFMFRHDFRMLLFRLDLYKHRPINIFWNCLCDTEYLVLPMSASPIPSCQQPVFLPGKLFIIQNPGKPPTNPSNPSPSELGIRLQCSSCLLNIPLLEHVSGQAIHVCLPIILLTRLGTFASRTFYLYLTNVFCFPEIFFLHLDPKPCFLWSTTWSQVLCLPVWF